MYVREWEKKTTYCSGPVVGKKFYFQTARCVVYMFSQSGFMHNNMHNCHYCECVFCIFSPAMGGCRASKHWLWKSPLSLCLYWSYITTCCVSSPGVSGFKIQNKLLGKCLQAQGGRVFLADCTSHSTSLEWQWLAESSALSSQLTGECLTSPGEQYEGVQLRPCITPAGILSLDVEAKSQAWSCSKKGHLTLMRSGLHLGAMLESTLVFLSREHKQVRTLQRCFCHVPINCHFITMIHFKCSNVILQSIPIFSQ